MATMDNRYESKWSSNDISVSDGLRIKPMEEKIQKLKDQIKRLESHLREAYKEKEKLKGCIETLISRETDLQKDNKRLQAEVDLIHSRFDLLDL